MAGETKYVVDIELNVSGDPAAKVGKIKDMSGDLAKELGKAGGALLGGFEGAVERVGGMVAGIGKVGLAAAVGAATYGVVGLNQELETTQVSLAAVLNANGIGGGMAGAMQQAAGWVKEMKKDAKDLPGEFSDLLGIVQSGASAAFNAGLDVKGFERLASQGMAAAKAMSVPIDQAGRELAQLLEGRAGAHNVFGTRLGIHADDFKGKTPEERVQLITTALGKFQPAIEVFGNTMDAQSSTLVDNVKTFIGTATGPLFGKVKGTLAEVNAWFDKNQATVELYAFKVGYALEQAFDKGKAVILEYGPIVWEFAGKAYDKIVRLWQDAEPYVKSIGAEIKSFLQDNGSFDKIGTILKLYIAAKGIGAMSSVASTLSPIISAGVTAFAGGSAAAGAGAAGGAAAGAGVAAGEGALALGTGGAGAAAGAAAAPAGIIAAIGAAIYEVIDAQSRSRTVDHSGGSAYGRSDKERKYIDDLAEKGIAAGKAMGDVTDAAYDVPAGFSAAADAAQEFASIIRSLSKSGDFDKVSQIVQSTLDADQAAKDAQAQSEQRTSDFMQSSAAMGILAANALAKSAADEKKAADDRKKAGRGSGGTTIGKVEISVSTNQNAGQFARQVGAYLARQNRQRTSSPFPTNYTSFTG